MLRVQVFCSRTVTGFSSWIRHSQFPIASSIRERVITSFYPRKRGSTSTMENAPSAPPKQLQRRGLLDFGDGRNIKARMPKGVTGESRGYKLRRCILDDIMSDMSDRSEDTEKNDNLVPTALNTCRIVSEGRSVSWRVLCRASPRGCAGSSPGASVCRLRRDGASSSWLIISPEA